MANETGKTAGNGPKPGENLSPEVGRASGSIRDSAFYQGVAETTRVPTYVIDTKYLDPQKVERLLAFRKSENAQSLEELYMKAEKNPALQKAIDDLGNDIKAQMTAQNMPLRRGWTPSDYARYAIEGIYRGPRAYTTTQDKVESCIVTNAPYDPMRLAVTNFPAGFPLKDLPGNRQNYERFVGRHEAGHCNDHDDTTGNTVSLHELLREVTADSAALQQDLANPATAIEAAAFMDLRALNFVHGSGGFSHATAFFLDDKGNKKLPTENSINELAHLKDNMIDIVARGTQIPKPHVENLLKINPAAFAALLKDQLEENDPKVIGRSTTAEGKAMMSRYIAAAERRLFDTNPADPAPAAEPKKLSLSDILNPDRPIIYQGSGTHIANALQSTGQNIEIQKSREADIGPPMTAQQILTADTTSAQTQKRDIGLQLS